jgi:hypothetical protein
MMEKFLVTTHNQEGVQSQDEAHKPAIVEAETMLQAAEALGGVVLVDANQFILVGRIDGKKVMRFVVTPIINTTG